VFDYDTNRLDRKSEGSGDLLEEDSWCPLEKPPPQPSVLPSSPSDCRQESIEKRTQYDPEAACRALMQEVDYLQHYAQRCEQRLLVSGTGSLFPRFGPAVGEREARERERERSRSPGRSGSTSSLGGLVDTDNRTIARLRKETYGGRYEGSR